MPLTRASQTQVGSCARRTLLSAARVQALTQPAHVLQPDSRDTGLSPHGRASPEAQSHGIARRAAAWATAWT